MVKVVNNKVKRVSKKNKSSWRKHVNIDDVESFLEEKRLEERIGWTDGNDLFEIDNKPTNLTRLTLKQKRRVKLAEIPKCFAMLYPHTKVEDPIKKRNRVRTKEERMCPILKRKREEKQRLGILSAREIQSMKDRQKNKEPKEKTDSFRDIWGCEGKSDLLENLRENEWINKETKQHTLRGLGIIENVKKPLNKKAKVSAIESPHPGISYNPSFEDHQNLLKDVVDKELKIMKEEQHINRVTRDMFRKVTRNENAENWLNEMSEGLDMNDKDETMPETDEKSWLNPPVINKKKTKQQIRKQKEQTLLKHELMLKKVEKKKRADMHKLKVINSNIENEQANQLERKKKELQKKTMLENQPKRLGKLKFEEPDAIVNMAQDISGNLKNIRKAGNLLADRFVSLQRRNILPVTTRQTCKQGKVKRFLKHGFEDFRTPGSKSTFRRGRRPF